MKNIPESCNRRDFILSGGKVVAGLGLASALPRIVHGNTVDKTEKVKILLDTDIGSDIDDAVCLAYLLANPRCDLLGITTVTGEPEKRAWLASALCKKAGKEVPIYVGAANPLLIEQRQKLAQQAKALGNWPHDRKFPKGQAIDFLRHQIRAHPGEVTLLTIGPLTNIALLFAMDPELPGLLKGLVMMCGKYTGYPSPWGPTEWNAILDPHATAMVFRQKVALQRTIGLDVTLQVVMTPEEVRERFKKIPLLQPVYDFSKVWFEERDILQFHDPLAAAIIFNDDICRFERGDFAIELENRDLLGVTHWTPEPAAGRHYAAMKVNPDKFFEEYFSVFS